ncbi:MAG: hypothetical protein Q8N63_05980 [Nanoarchaeota archaeon]|nr:hypothetical protein [Nanoarchaeota archaeon]
MRLEIEAQERCLGQVTKTQIHPEITEGRGNCAICRYDPINNINCAVYRDKANRVPVKFLDVVG